MKLLFQPLPHDEAAAMIGGLPPLLRSEFDQLLPELKAYAFTVTGLTQLGAITEARDNIAKVATGETTFAKVKKELTTKLSPFLDEKQAVRRAELLLRTHTSRAFSASGYRNLMAQADVFPYWIYKLGNSRVHRPWHKKLENRIIATKHPLTQLLWPPKGFGCNCMGVPMLGSQAEAIRALDARTAPEHKRVLDGELADAIAAGQRLPDGTSLAPEPNWNWEPGRLRPDLADLRKRYEAADPQAWAEFEKWARKTTVAGQSGGSGQTIWSWLEGEPLKIEKPVPAVPPVVPVVTQPVVPPPSPPVISRPSLPDGPTVDQLLALPAGTVPEELMASAMAREPDHAASAAMKVWGDDEDRFTALMRGDDPESPVWKSEVSRVLNVLGRTAPDTQAFRGWHFESAAERDALMAKLFSNQGIFEQQNTGMSASHELEIAASSKFFNEHGVIWEIKGLGSAVPVARLFEALRTKFPHEKEVIVLQGALLNKLAGPELREISLNGQIRTVVYYEVEEIKP